MNPKWYQRIINNNEKSPFEGGIQALVYMLLQECFLPKENIALLVVDRAQKKSRFSSYTGVPDLAVVTDDFEYDNEEKGKVLLSVEIKVNKKAIEKNYEQILGHLLAFSKVLYTDGREWWYYDLALLRKEVDDSFDEFDKNIKEVVRIEKELAVLRGRLRGLNATKTRKEKKGEELETSQIGAISDCEERIKTCNANLNEPREYVEKWLEEKKECLEKYVKKGDWNNNICVMDKGEVNDKQLKKLEDNITELAKILSMESKKHSNLQIGE